MIFFPSRYPEGYWEPVGIDPEDVYFTTDDGVRLHAWYLPAESPVAEILLCHGNAGNLSHRAEVIRVLRDFVGASVLIFDYRGYGRSEGRPSEKGILQDARAARRVLAEKAGIDEGDAVLLGRSIGGAVAVDLAAADGARGLVLESTFTSLPDVAARLYPYLPIRLIMRTRLNSAAKIGKYKGPLLQSHGDADTIVPYEVGRRLFQASGKDESSFMTIKGGDHNDPQPREYYERLREFLDSLDPPP